MSQFVDQVLLSLGDEAEFKDFVDPDDDAEHDRILALMRAMYDTPYARIHEVRDVTVASLERSRPLFSPRDNRGTWTQTTPSYARSDVHWHDTDRTAPLWVDIAADLSVTVVLEIDAGEVESIIVREIERIASLADFRSRFRFLDLDAFLEEHDISTVADLRARFKYLLTEVRLRQSPPFDPDDPANQRRYELSTVVLIRDTLDVSEALRAAKLARAVLKSSAAYREQAEADMEVTSPYAPVVVFPAELLGDPPFDETGVRDFFAAEDVLAVFVPAT